MTAPWQVESELSEICADVVRHMRHVGSEKIDGTDHFNQIAGRLIIAHSNHSIRVERRKIMTHRGHSQPWQYSTRYPCARSEEHTSALQYLMRTSYDGFRLKTKK